MQIHFERTGGFAGIRLTVEVDTKALSPEAVRELRKMVEAAGFFELPAVILVPDPGADRFQYMLTVEVDGRRHTVWTDEAAAPVALRPLLDWLVEVARKVHRGSGTR